MRFPEHEDKSNDVLFAFVETHTSVPQGRALAELACRSVAQAELRPRVFEVIAQNLEWIQGAVRGTPNGFVALEVMFDTADRATIEELFVAMSRWSDTQRDDFFRLFRRAGDATMEDLRASLIAEAESR